MINVEPSSLPDLAVLALGGEPLPVRLAAIWAPALRLLNTYGVTEAAVYQTVHHVTCPVWEEGVWDNVVGEALPDVRLHVDEATGELWVGGDQVHVCCEYVCMCERVLPTSSPNM
jgi:long-subunit acyl-CoA synthetase (AMP-forming)